MHMLTCINLNSYNEYYSIITAMEHYTNTKVWAENLCSFSKEQLKEHRVDASRGEASEDSKKTEL